MGPQAQAIVAGVLVLASALYAAWKLMTPRGRLALVGWLASAAPGPAGRWLARRRDALASAAAGGCHTCAAGGTKRHGTAAKRSTVGAPTRQPAGEIGNPASGAVSPSAAPTRTRAAPRR